MSEKCQIIFALEKFGISKALKAKNDEEKQM